jgi:hypothetical protein
MGILQLWTGECRAGTQEKVQSFMMQLLLALALPAQLGAAMPADSVERLRSRARTAEAQFERVSRSLAPYTWASGSGRDCDEIVGRFCLTFASSVTRPTVTEVGRVIDARRDAIEALRRYFSAAPHARDAAAPLVRLLVLDDRASEALSAARSFSALSTDTLWAELLQGLAYHAMADNGAAERSFVHALGRMDEATRRRWADPTWLLDYREQRELRAMDARQRAEYERRFWIVSNPLWLTPANERWVEHMARHATARLLADAPRVMGSYRWGPDLDQLTVRYGSPAARAQVRGNNPWDASTFVEYFDTAQRAYTPERWLSAGFPAQPAPGEEPPIYAPRARSGQALRTVSRVLDLPHQLTRFVAGDEVVIRVDGALPRPPDAGNASQVTLGLFAYDSAFTRRVQTVSTRQWSGDTLPFSLAVRVPPSDLVYSVEALDSAADFAARARYSLPALLPDDGPVVSDLLLCLPFEDGALPARRDAPGLRARSTLVVSAGETLGVYAEVYRIAGTGPEAVRVELALEPADAPGVFTRFARWLGRTAGVVQPRSDPRVAWQAATEDEVFPLALNLPLDPARHGRHVLVLRVTDLQTNREAETRRALLIRPR